MEKHIVLEVLLKSVRDDWSDSACENVERVFNSQEADIDKLFKANKILKDEYESLLMDYERLTDNPSVVYGQTYVETLKEQVTAGGRQVQALVDEIGYQGRYV